MSFQKQNNLIGWILFLFTSVVYTLTLEPTLSLWDCGELLVSAYRLEISHAPGAPLFMMIGRIFSLLSFGNSERAAMMINLVSAMSSAATVMFLYWTLVWVVQKFAGKTSAFIGGAIGALTFAFTDSFWFSAVEAEVYALSLLFVAVILWAATKWDREADQSGSTRWILLIFFLTGLSIGVHLLSLLVLPAVGMIIYYRKFTFRISSFLLFLSATVLLILFLMMVFLPGVFSLAGPLELLAVNKLKMPVNSGFYIYVLLLAGLFITLLIISHRKKKHLMNLVVLSVLFLMLGYTSYLATFIRSAANPPVDQGNPETTFGLIDYLNRESYGTRPILYGKNYGSELKSYKERNTYELNGDKYEPVDLNPKVYYDENTTSFFPRLHSNEPEHMKAYRNWVDMTGRKAQARDRNGELKVITIPTFSENLMFFIRYQFGHMYLRYFMWNFVGKQNDIQGFGEPENGNWKSGIGFIDKIRLGDQDKIPSAMKNNKGNNSYYFLPMLLGLLGAYQHYKKEKRSFSVLAILFGLLSVGLVVYLNEIPLTPRERDYVFVGSFYIFCVWIGIGVVATVELLSKLIKMRPAIVVASILGFLFGPGILLSQNYDDHDRSGRYSARDLARNYLECCEPNAILFTHADNDTYPLWYCQEVEGIRQDVRVIVMPYLNAGWYLRQINRKIHENPGVKYSVPLEKYFSGELDYMPVAPKIESEQSILKLFDFVASDSSKTKLSTESGERISYIPLNKTLLPVGNQDIPVGLNKRYYLRSDLTFFDIIASNSNERPIYFTSLADPKMYGLQDYLRYDGMVYRLVSEKTATSSVLDAGKIDTDILYTNLMERCNWENLKDSTVYFDWHHRRMFAVAQIRGAFLRLAEKLAEEGSTEKAKAVIDEARAVLPFRLWEVDYQSVKLCDLCTRMSDSKSGEEYVKEIKRELEEWIEYYESFEGMQADAVARELEMKLYLYQMLTELTMKFDKEAGSAMNDKLKDYLLSMQKNTKSL